MTLYRFLFLLPILLIACAQPNPEAQKQYLEGYWEIKEVQFNNKKKDFDINLMVDHIAVEGDVGKRAKVVPQLDGSYSTNEVSESFTLKIENDSLRMYYTTPFDQWQETVIKADDSTLVIKNRDDKLYTYKKYDNKPIINK